MMVSRSRRTLETGKIASRFSNIFGFLSCLRQFGSQSGHQMDKKTDASRKRGNRTIKTGSLGFECFPTHYLI